MGFLRRIENGLEGVFEGGIGRTFRSHVQPVELARKLAKEMDDHRTISVSQVYVPNVYTLYLSPDDREQFATYEASLRTELAGYLGEHARREGYTIPGRVRVLVETAEELPIGSFGISVAMQEAPPRAAQPPAAKGPARPAASPSKPREAELPAEFMVGGEEPSFEPAVPPVPVPGPAPEPAPELEADEQTPPEPEQPVAEGEPDVDARPEDAEADAEPQPPEAAAEPDQGEATPDEAAPADEDADEPEGPEAGTERALPAVPLPVPPSPVPAPVVPLVPSLPDVPVDASDDDDLESAPYVPPAPAPTPPPPPRARPAPPPDTMVISRHEAGARDLVREEWALTWPGGRFAIERRAIVLGRSRDCDVVLADTNVSRRHAELVRHGGGFVLRDLDSTNGSMVNGRRVREAPVTAGDVLTLGTTTLRLERKRT
jgi:hypothetical protein